MVYELTAGQVGTGFAWKLYICCAVATPVSGSRVASGLHPGTPKGVKVFFTTSEGSEAVASQKRAEQRHLLPLRSLDHHAYSFQHGLGITPISLRGPASTASALRHAVAVRPQVT